MLDVLGLGAVLHSTPAYHKALSSGGALLWRDQRCAILAGAVLHGEPLDGADVGALAETLELADHHRPKHRDGTTDDRWAVRLVELLAERAEVELLKVTARWAADALAARGAMELRRVRQALSAAIGGAAA